MRRSSSDRPRIEHSWRTGAGGGFWSWRSGATWLLCWLACAAGVLGRAAPTTPNVVFILADDLGYGSVGCYGAPAALRTPNIDRLAREGRRFTQAYAPGAVCSPTRYALLTGRYYWRTSVKHGRVLGSGAPLLIETSRPTLASLFQDRGYVTAIVGKWHLGLGNGGLENRVGDWSGKIAPGPLEVGFSQYFGQASNLPDGPHNFIENHRLLDVIPGQAARVNRTPGVGGGGTTSGLAGTWNPEQVMERITTRAVEFLEQNAHQPFFLYFATNAVHRPVAPQPRFHGSPFGEYGDFIEELDWSVGEVLQALDRLGLAEDTLVIFSSDNGGVIKRQQQEIARAIDSGLEINGGLRGGKESIYEGGVREPFLARWPGRIPAGTVSPVVISLADMLATCACLLDATLPDGSAEDSVNVWPAFTEPVPGGERASPIVLQALDGTYAIRVGPWKLIERAGAPVSLTRRGGGGERTMLWLPCPMSSTTSLPIRRRPPTCTPCRPRWRRS